MAKNIESTIVRFNQTSVNTVIRAEFHCVSVCVQAERAALALALAAGSSSQLCFNLSFIF